MDNYVIPKKVKIARIKAVKNGADGSKITTTYENITCDVKPYYKKDGENLSLFYNEDGFKELIEGDKADE